MKLGFPIVVLLIAIFNLVKCDDMVFGSVSDGAQLVKHELVEHKAVPLKKRVKYYTYSGPENMKIQGIQALDTKHSKATIKITAGGIGSNFVELRMKSERGQRLRYNIVIYGSTQK